MPLLLLTATIASKPVARPTGLLPAALTRLPASILAIRRYAPGPRPKQHFPHSLTKTDQVSNI
jgi:hypothetical protein